MRNLLIGLLVGILLLGIARFAFAPLNRTTHHHANWVVTIDDTELDLSDDRFMEEIAACTDSDSGILPTQRIHMHENEDHVVHVHHPGSTWGHLATNLGLAMGSDFLFLDRQLVDQVAAPGAAADGTTDIASTDVGPADPIPADGRIVDRTDDDHRLVFVLNGFAVPSVHNRVVSSEDRLLVAWTDRPVDEVVSELYPQVPSNAGEYNERMDPASCSGGHGELPFLTRLRLAFWG